jgi:curved DNA-binding protein CbpA
MSEPDYYEILQVSPRAESDVIEAAYRRLARRYHPDINPDVAALQRMRELNRAFEILIDLRKRAEYDRRRLRALAQKAMAEQPIQPYGTLSREGESVGWRARLRRVPFSWLLIACGVTIVLSALTLMAIQEVSDSGSGAPNEEARQLSPAPRSPAAAGALSTPNASSAPSPRENSGTFSNGTWLVGEEIAPGIWRAIRSRACSWKRLSSIEGSTDTIAGSGSYLTVEIPPSDAAFSSEGCGWWTQILTPPSSSPEDPFGPGTWLVNQEIGPGLWQNSDSSEGCSWSRLKALDGGPNALGDTGFGYTTIVIEINKADRAFDSSGCGTWTRIGG